MHQLKEWGTIELNPLMWLTIWRKHKDSYITTKNNYENELVLESMEPKTSTNFLIMPADVYSTLHTDTIATTTIHTITTTYTKQHHRHERRRRLRTDTGKKYVNTYARTLNIRNKFIAVRQRETTAENIKQKVFYCDEGIEELLLQMKNNARPR